MKWPLVVIDVQDDFLVPLQSDTDKYLDQVVKAVRRARRIRRHIILLQYASSGSTNQRVRAELKGYDQYTIVYKRKNGGAAPLTTKLKQILPAARTLLICGINLEYCVRDTVHGLVWRDYRCHILRKATCNAFKGYYEPADEGFLERAFVGGVERRQRRVGVPKDHVDIFNEQVAKNVRLSRA